jgi:hypothetical protein
MSSLYTVYSIAVSMRDSEHKGSEFKPAYTAVITCSPHALASVSNIDCAINVYTRRGKTRAEKIRDGLGKNKFFSKIDAASGQSRGHGVTGAYVLACPGLAPPLVSKSIAWLTQP